MNQNHTVKEELKTGILTSSGKITAEIVFKNGKIVDVLSHRIIEGDIAVSNGFIAGIGEYKGKSEIDLKGRYIIPGLIDAHVHMESSHVTPERYAEAVVPHGTTTVIADPHEIANVLGSEGIRYMIDSSKNIPLKVYFMIPSCVPATSFEHAGAVLEAEDISALMGDERVLGLGELMDYPSVVSAAESVLDKILTAAARGKLIDGHAPMLFGNDLSAYAAAGVRTDHECSTVDEMLDRLSRGMYVLLREGSAAQNLKTLLKGVTPENSRRCAFCTDDRQPDDLLTLGHIDNHLRIAVKNGIDPVTAVQMATLNAAECYKLDRTGAVAPGFRADFAVVDNLQDFNVLETFVGGEKAAEKGIALFGKEKNGSIKGIGAINVKKFSPDQFNLFLETERARVISLESMSLFTPLAVRTVSRDHNGFFKVNPDSDIVKLAVVERHHGTGNIAVGLVENYGLKGGAIASSYAHDSHNIIVAGDNNEDMYTAVQELIRVNGGITMAAKGKVLDTLKLPIAGIMSDLPLTEVRNKIKDMHAAAFDLLKINRGIDPFMTLSFLSLPVIPELKLTDRGLFNVKEFRFVDAAVREN